MRRAASRDYACCTMTTNDVNAFHTRRDHLSQLPVPPEILIEIIDEAANDRLPMGSIEMLTSDKWDDVGDNYPCERLCNFTLVSFRWYQTVIEVPRLWTRLRLDASHYSTEASGREDLRMLKYCLARSKEHRLYITLTGRAGRWQDLYLSTLLQSCSRWHALTVSPTFFDLKLSRELVEMPQLAVLQGPADLPPAFKMTAGALKTTILRANQVARLRSFALDDFLFYFLGNLAHYAQVTSLLCTGIEIPSASRKEILERLESDVFNFTLLPNLVNLVLIDCKLGDVVLVNLLRSSPVLESLVLHLTNAQSFGPYWNTLCSPVKRLEIIPGIWESSGSDHKLTTLLRSVPFVETICWRQHWRPAASVKTLLLALALGTDESLSPKLRHLEFEDAEIDMLTLFALCVKHSTPQGTGNQAGDIRNALRITVHKGCVYKDSQNGIMPFPRVESMIWRDLDKMMFSPR